MNCQLLFVYGTLRRGSARHAILRRLGAEFIGEGSIRAELFDCGEWPGARKSAANHAQVAGEIYRLRNSARALKVLDKVEGFRPQVPEASLFTRETTEVVLLDGKQTPAWVYWLNRRFGPMRRIPSGDYAEI